MAFPGAVLPAGDKPGESRVHELSLEPTLESTFLQVLCVSARPGAGLSPGP